MHILIIEPAFSCLMLLPKAKALGHHISVISANKADRIIPLEYRCFIDNFIINDTNNIDLLLIEARKINNTAKIEGVLPGSEYHICLTAFVAHDLALPGHCIDTVEALRNKYFMRDLLTSTDVRIPEYRLIHSVHDLITAAQKTGFPAVLKPTSMAGGLNVRKVSSLVELTEAYQTVKNSDIKEMDHSSDNGLLLESYISGKMFSVEGFVSKDQLHIVSITEKLQCAEPSFVEMGHIVQANLSEEEREQIFHYVSRVIKVLKITLGVFHLELKIDQDGPVIIEIAGRLPGCRIVDLIRLARGVDLVEMMVKTHLNQQISRPEFSCNTAGIQFFSVPNGTNQYSTIDGWEKLKDIPCFYESKVSINPCVLIDHPETFNGRVAHAIFCADNYEQVASAMLRARELIKIN